MEDSFKKMKRTGYRCSIVEVCHNPPREPYVAPVLISNDAACLACGDAPRYRDLSELNTNMSAY